MQEYLSVTELVEEVIEKTGYREMLKAEKTIEAQSRFENIDEFLSVTKSFEEISEDKSLVAFLTDLALVADIDQLDEEDEEVQDKCHFNDASLSKRLEFPVVFFIGLEEGVFPHSRSLMEEDEMEEERRLSLRRDYTCRRRIVYNKCPNAYIVWTNEYESCFSVY